jgi:hypothetical protein
MGISLNPSDAIDPVVNGIAEGATRIAQHITSRSPVTIDRMSFFELENSGDLLITASGEEKYKAEYTLSRVDRERKKRERKETSERIEADIAEGVAVVKKDLEAAADARIAKVEAEAEERIARAIATHGVSSKGEPGGLRAQDLELYRFDTDTPVDDDQKIYDGLLSQGDLTVWVGHEKHRKSNFLLMLAICLAVGLSFLGFQFLAEAPMCVVYFDYESRTGSLKRRYDSIVAALNLTADQRELLKLNLNIIEVRRTRKNGVSFPKFPHRKADPEGLDFWHGLVEANPAEFYIFDPLRALHSGDENESNIEFMLTELHRAFRGKSVVAAHHMRKAGDNSARLVEDMRAWSEGARGSSAIKATADVIVLQERSTNRAGEEVVHFGAFLRDGADIEPFPLMESDHESFFWQRVQDIPDRLQASVEALRFGIWANKSRVAVTIVKGTGVGRATAFRQIDEMIRAKIITVTPGGGFERTQGIPNEQAA